MVLLRLCLFILYFSLIVEHPPSPATSYPPRRNYEYISPKIDISFVDAIKISILGILSTMLLLNSLLQLCISVRFIEFTTNLCIKPKFTSHTHNDFQPIILLILYGILLNEYEESWYFLLCNFRLNSLYGIKNVRKKSAIWQTLHLENSYVLLHYRIAVIFSSNIIENGYL